MGCPYAISLPSVSIKLRKRACLGVARRGCCTSVERYPERPYSLGSPPALALAVLRHLHLEPGERPALDVG